MPGKRCPNKHFSLNAVRGCPDDTAYSKDPMVIERTLECTLEINILRDGILQRQSKNDVQRVSQKAESSVD